MQEDKIEFDINQWYTPKQAAERLSRNSGKVIGVSYPRKLHQYGKVRAFKISERNNLYFRSDIDSYIVEEKTTKAARARRIKAVVNPLEKKGSSKKRGNKDVTKLEVA